MAAARNGALLGPGALRARPASGRSAMTARTESCNESRTESCNESRTESRTESCNESRNECSHWPQDVSFRRDCGSLRVVQVEKALRQDAELSEHIHHRLDPQDNAHADHQGHHKEA